MYHKFKINTFLKEQFLPQRLMLQDLPWKHMEFYAVFIARGYIYGVFVFKQKYILFQQKEFRSIPENMKS